MLYDHGFILYYTNLPRFRGDTVLRDTATSIPRTTVSVFQPTIFEPTLYHPPTMIRIEETKNPVRKSNIIEPWNIFKKIKK